MVLVGPPGPGPPGPGPPGPICGALFEGPTELEPLEQPARITRGARSKNIRTTGSFFSNMSFVRNMTDEWLYWSDNLAIKANPSKPFVDAMLTLLDKLS
jgi:hypothetical protein